MKSQTALSNYEAISNIHTSKPSKSESVNELQKLFVDELKDIYWAEKSLTALLPKMIDRSASEELAEGILDHLALTLNHITRLEAVFSAINIKAESKKCETMSALIEDANRIMKEMPEGTNRDNSIISINHKIQFYEIATYGILCSFAKTLGEIEALTLLEDTLNEEKTAYKTLFQIRELIAAEAYHEDELVIIN